MSEQKRQSAQVKTVLLCKSLMLRVGLEHMLAGSAFRAQSDADEEDRRSRRSQQAEEILYILDLGPDLDEVASAVSSLKSQNAEARVVVVSDLFGADALSRLCAEGADGFCLTSSNQSILVKALELAMLGETYFPASIVKNILSRKESVAETAPATQFEGELPVDGQAKERLSGREIEILRFLMRGIKNRDIASSLNLSEATIKVYIQGILKKIGAENRTQAAMWATGMFSQKS